MITRNNNALEKNLRKNKSLLILGPRGSGKTYYINNLLLEFKNVFKIDLLNNELYIRYLKNPELLMGEISLKIIDGEILYIFIDEIQRIPQLLNEVHRSIEEYKEQIVFILTGSSARKLKSHGANLLAGRALLMPFYPINMFEIDPKITELLSRRPLSEIINSFNLKCNNLILEIFCIIAINYHKS